MLKPDKIRQAFYISAGFLIWAITFVLLYSMLSVGCVLNWHSIDLIVGLTFQRLQLVLIFLCCLMAYRALLRSLRRRKQAYLQNAKDRFIHTVSTYGAWAGCAASLGNFVWVIFLTECGFQAGVSL